MTIPGVGDVLIPGYMIPTPAGLSASRLTGGSSPVAALGYLALYHTTCAGPLTLRAEVSGEARRAAGAGRAVGGRPWRARCSARVVSALPLLCSATQLAAAATALNGS